jgi:UDP-N-acetylglucosamine 2-epimerase (non-hydrolysing)
MKIAPILWALERRESSLSPVLVHTGQHYDRGMSDVFFEQLAIPAPDVHLGVGSATHGVQTARVISAFEEYLLDAPARPRGVIVVGDVNSTMAAALAAVKLEIPVAHVEAGLRSFDRTMPEEINRVVTDAVAELLLVSEPSGAENLRREGIPEHRIHSVGNVMIDTLVRELPAAEALGMPERLKLEPGGFALITLHRPSNVDSPERLEPIVGLLEQLASRLPIVFPAHPRTRERIERFGLMDRIDRHQQLLLREPLGYRENLGLMRAARFVLTDSGGVQEETTYLGIPCLTLRPNTERPVTVTLGTNTLVADDIVQTKALVDTILDGSYKRGSAVPQWDGSTAERIVDLLEAEWT